MFIELKALFLQVFYTCHIGGFIGFMIFAFMHYQAMWTYTYPGTAFSASTLSPSITAFCHIAAFCQGAQP